MALKKTYLKDYKPTDFNIKHVLMDVQFFKDNTLVTTTAEISRAAHADKNIDLVLDGDELVLEAISLNGKSLSDAAFEASPEKLVVKNPPQKFKLTITTKLEPHKNTKLMGLYRSNKTWCTQCEAEGFRRITYFLDRPDCLSTYEVRLEGDKKQAPVLLANGNLIETGDAGDDRHFARWADPHPKPCYLFAMVAGDLDVVKDEFTTSENKKVDLAIYCEKGKAKQCTYAMDALKRSMLWDERTYGLAYDLDIFNIVAVSDFNMGAMENKGLNIFNDKYVLADPNTATDADYANIETVIAHEYFHNYSGNRITCRDWFQLCLKEGLTVFRDQTFSEDERSEGVKRVEDVLRLRSQQFSEDAGPLAHPVQPKSFSEINNFYTATIYEKGAEVVRMLRTFLGKEKFRAAMDDYYQTYDGTAATIEDFLSCFERAGLEDVDQFRRWYDQAGTPNVVVEHEYNRKDKSYTLTLSQVTAPTPGQKTKRPLDMPISFALLGTDGEPMKANVETGTAFDDILRFNKARQNFKFTDVTSRPVPSLFRGFCAPIKLQSGLSERAKIFLASHDDDPFNRFEAMQELGLNALKRTYRSLRANKKPSAPIALIEAMQAAILDDGLEPAFKAQLLKLPSQTSLANALGQSLFPESVFEAIKIVERQIGVSFEEEFEHLYTRLTPKKRFTATAEQAGQRTLRHQALSFLLAAKPRSHAPLAHTQFEEAKDMTTRMAALSAVLHNNVAGADDVLEAFYDQFKSQALVIDKWFGLHATRPNTGVAQLNKLMKHKDFSLLNPNRARALIGMFAMGNPAQFAHPDGEAFQWVCDRIQEIDGQNPQLAARLMTAFKSWRTYEAKRAKLVHNVLVALKDAGPLSKDTTEILHRILGD